MSKTAPEQARHEAKWFLRNCRDATDDLTDTAILIIDELVTNAYNAMSGRAAGARIYFSLRLFPDRLLIEVIDTSRQHPTLTPPDDASAENGRGLAIVNALSDEWGYFWHQARKVVYATLPISPRAT
jgi:anti-sigma regulatory factor (Ser/Thr protein kinase)